MSVNFPNKPANWKVSEFRKIAELRHGYQFRNYDFTSEGIKIFKITQIKGNATVDISSCSYIDPDRLKKFKGFRINKGDILMALTGATIGKIARYSENETILQNYRVGNFFPLDEEVLSKDFLYHFLRSKNFYNQILAGQTQSAQQNIGKEDINKMSILVPPIKEQKSIASILSALDDKIELNLQMNKTLEEMAMALYKHWFVDFGPFQDGDFVDSELGEIPKGWKVKRLDEISFVKGGKRLPKGTQLQTNPNSHPYLRVKDFNSTYLNVSGMEYVPDNVFSSISNYIVNTGDIALSIVGTIGKVALIGEDLNLASLTENCVKISPKVETIFSELIYLQLTSKNGQDEIQSKTVGSTQPKLPIYNINSLNFAFPSDFNEVKEAALALQYWFKIIYGNTIENQSLTQLRDTLLPKLISGEVRVKDVEKTLTEVL